jgi:hypothetical protein
LADSKTAEDTLLGRIKAPDPKESEGIQPMSLPDNIRGRLVNDPTSVTQTEIDFLDAFDLKKEQDSGLVLSPDEQLHLDNYSKLVNLTGTEFEANIPSALRESFLGTLAERELPDTEDLARQEASKEGGGALLDDTTRRNFVKSLEKVEFGGPGGLNLSGVMAEFDRLQAETEIERETIKAEHPEAYAQSKLATELMVGGAVGGAAQKAATSAITKIPTMAPTGLGRAAVKGTEVLGGFSKTPLKAGAEVIGGGVGAIAAESTLAPEKLVKGEFKQIRDAGMFGAGLTGVLGSMHAVAGPIGNKLKNIIENQSERFMDTAAHLAIRSVAPIQRALQRSLHRHMGPEAFGRELLRNTNAIPKFHTVRMSKYMDNNFEKARLKTGKDLGVFREEADEIADKTLEKLGMSVSKSASETGDDLGAGIEKISSDRETIDHFRRALRVDLGDVAAEARKVAAKHDPADTFSDKSQSAKMLSEWADKLDELPVRSRSIASASEEYSAQNLKAQFRPEIQQSGARTEGQRVRAMLAAEMIISDVMDKATIRNLKLKQMLPENFNDRDIEKAFGELGENYIKGAPVMERSQTPQAVQDMLDTQQRMDDLSRLYRVIRTSQTLIFEKNVAASTNNIVSLREMIAFASAFGGTQGGGLDKLEMGVGAGVLTRILTKKGPPVGARSMQFLSNRAKNLSASIGKISLGTEYLGDMPGLTPALYVALTRPDSPLQNHNFMVIKDPEYLQELKARISDDSDLNTTKKAQFISEINSKGEVRLIYKNAGNKNDVDTSPGMKGFREKLENFIPHDPSPLAPEGAPLSTDISQSPLKGLLEESPLFGKKKVGEALGPTGNLPIGKQIQGFLDTVLGAEQIGLDPGEKFPEGQISEEELANLQAQGIPPPTLLKVNFGKGKDRGLKGKKEIDAEPGFKSPEGLDVLLKDKAISKSKEAQFSIKNIANRKSLSQDTREAVIRLNTKGVKGDPYQGVDNGSVIWNSEGKKLRERFNMPIPVFKADIRDGTLGHKVKDGGSDPFTWIDHKHKATQVFLRKHGNKIKTINTRSDLIAQDDYMEMLPKGAEINIYAGPLSARDIAGKKIEPGNPSLKRRLSAAKKLKEKGFKVNIVWDVFRGKNKKMMDFLNTPDLSDPKTRGQFFNAKENIVELSPEMEKNLEKILGDFK